MKGKFWLIFGKTNFHKNLKILDNQKFLWSCYSRLGYYWLCDLPSLKLRFEEEKNNTIHITFPQICLHDGIRIDPDARDGVSTEEIKQFLKTFIKDHFPDVEPEVAVEESCIYTLTPDQNPIIDRIPEKKNIVVAAGFSGMGFKLGPVTGRMLADMAMDPTSKQEEDILNIQRFIKLVEWLFIFTKIRQYLMV